MTILLVLIPVGVLLLAVAIAAFVWAVRNDQFEDLESEGARILFDDPEPARGQPLATAEAGAAAASSSAGPNADAQTEQRS
jgi:cbb3-type cytochrome oxidase maturation protein